MSQTRKQQIYLNGKDGARKWDYITIQDKKKGYFNKKAVDAKNYALISYKTLNNTWSKPIQIGSIKFKKMLLNGSLPLKDFPQYKIANVKNRKPYIYFDQNSLGSIGKSVKKDFMENNSDSDQYISYTLMFYAKEEDLINKVGDKKIDRYTYRPLTINGKTAYPLFHREFHINSKKSVLRDFFKLIKANDGIWKLNNNTLYQYFWDKFIPNVGGQNSLGIERGAIDSIRDISYGFFNNIRELSQEEVNQLDFRIAVAMDDKFMNAKNFIQKNSYDQKEKYVYPLYPGDSYSFFPKNGCFFVYFMMTYKYSIEKRCKSKPRPKYQNFSYSALWKIIHGDKPIPEENDYTSWGVCWNDMIKVFKHYRIEATLYDGFDAKPRLHYHPQDDGLTVDKNITPNHFRFVWSNNHIWVLDKNGNENWCNKLKNKKERLIEFSSQIDVDLTINQCYPVPYNFSHLKRKNQTFTRFLMHTTKEIYDFLQIEDKIDDPKIPNQYVIITNMNLEQLFLELRQEYGLQAKIDMRGGAINKLFIHYYYNKNVSIQQAFNPSTAQCIVHDIKDYDLMYEYLEKIKKILLIPQYLSVYNNQVFSIFQKFKKGGMVGCFNFNFNPECCFTNDDGELQMENPLVGCSDFNRFYISDLLSYEYFPIFNIDDYFVDVEDSHIIEDLNLYYVKKSDMEFVYPFYKDDLCFGIHLKNCPKENYTIIKYIRPSSFRENPLKDIFIEIYNSNLPDDLKKNIGNILCGYLVQKSVSVHKSFFSENRNEVELFRREIGGCIYPFTYKDNEVGYAFSKSFSQPLLSGFYFLGLLLLDGTHWKMHQLNQDLISCHLEPFAIKTDCIYHSNDSKKYDIFKQKFSQYFNYKDRNDFDALGKIKYDEIQGNIWNEYIYKDFDFDFSMPNINHIPIKNEWVSDEFISAIESHRSLLFTGHGGYGKSSSVITACKKMDKKILILVRMHPLADEWHSKNNESFEVMTAESFFKLSPYSNIPFNKISYEKLDDKYAVLIDDGLLCHLKIWNQWYFFNIWCSIYKPDLKLIGTLDHLQLNMLLNDDLNSFKNFAGNKKSKLLNFGYHLFENIITLKENKRLKDPVERKLCKEYIKIIESENMHQLMQFRQDNMNVVQSFYDIPLHIRKDIRNFIVAENKERSQFNRIAFAFEHGQYSQKWQIGHIIMANYSNNSSSKYIPDPTNRYSSFQQFKIISNDGNLVKLQNVKKVNHFVNVPFDILQKHFDYPYSRTCHSWQGMTCDGKLVIFGTNHLYNGIDWHYTAESRPRSFKDIWHIIPKSQLDDSLNRSQFLQQKINGYIRQDLNRGFKINYDSYITVQWIELELRRSEWKCHYCTENIFYGWVIDRLNNDLPHYTYNCHCCCVSCNRSKK